MLCSDPKLDSHRFKDILDETIAAGKCSYYLLLIYPESLLFETSEISSPDSELG